MLCHSAYTTKYRERKQIRGRGRGGGGGGGAAAGGRSRGDLFGSGLFPMVAAPLCLSKLNRIVHQNGWLSQYINYT